MRIIELCAGYGGLGIGVKIAIPSARVVCAIERQAYTVARWRELVEAEAVEPVAIWPDVESFAWAMAQRNRKRLGLQLPQCDMLTAGFPCQPFSQAGKRRGIEDHRWIWPAIRRTIGVLGPRYVFLENVAGILNAGGFGRVIGDLAALGFNAEWDCIPAADAGANHFRFRVFVLAWRRNDAEHTLCERCGGIQEHQGQQAEGGGRVAPADATDAAGCENLMGRDSRQRAEREPATEQIGMGSHAADATRGGWPGGGITPGSNGLVTGGGPDDGHTDDMVSHRKENARCSRGGEGSPEAPRDDKPRPKRTTGNREPATATGRNRRLHSSDIRAAACWTRVQWSG